MRLEKLFTILFLVLMVGTPLTGAQAFDLYAGGSYTEIEDADGVWGGVVGAAIPVFTDYFRLDGRIYIFEEATVEDGFDLEFIPIDLGAQIHLLPDATLDPYLLAGASWMYTDSDDFDVDNSFGVYTGLGLDYAFTEHLKPYAEVLFRYNEVDLDGNPSRDDLELGGLTANVGLKFHF